MLFISKLWMKLAQSRVTFVKKELVLRRYTRSLDVVLTFLISKVLEEAESDTKIKTKYKTFIRK